MKRTSYFIILLLLCSSCSYFRVIPQNNYTTESIIQYDTSGKYIVLHAEEDAWHVYNLYVEDDSIHAILYFQLGYHAKYLDAKEKGLNKFRRKKEPQVSESVHIYSYYDELRVSDSLIVIPFSSIYTVKSYEYARAPSRTTVILPIVIASIPVSFFIVVLFYAMLITI